MQRLKFNLFQISISVFIIAISLFPQEGYSKQQSLPAECTTQCRSTFGEVLGVGVGNVPAYSNCNANCVVFSPNKNEGTYTGIKWQCVEYARRWLLVNKGVVYGDVDIAADIWNLDKVTRVKDKRAYTLSTYPNGNVTVPAVGDLLIYAKAYLNTGHVAVVSKVDTKSNTIQVIEQNFDNTKWSGDYARSIPIVKEKNKYWVLDSYLLGWKRVSDKPAQ